MAGEIGASAPNGRLAGLGLDEGRISYLSPEALRSLNLVPEEGSLLAASPKTGKRKPARPKPGSPKPGGPKPGGPKPGSPKPGSPKPPGSPK